LFLDLKSRRRLGSFLNYQDVPKGIHVCLHGHTHEIGQRYDWINNTLIVNCCVEQWDYRPTSLRELEQEYYLRKDYYERKQ
jgi:calcineurin-like phosphoesterase family protein